MAQRPIVPQSLNRLQILSAHLNIHTDGPGQGLASRDCSAKSFNLDGKVVLVTGGGDGIGGGMVRSFSEAGATVFYCDLKEHASPPTGATFIQCDVRDRAAIANTVAQVARASGGMLDVLCNNVGVVLEAGRPLHETSDEAWDTTLAVNLTSYFKFSQACIPLMLAAGAGCIIQTASVQGLQSMAGVCSYAASKGAISSLTRQMAVEYADKGIRVNSICPGTIATPMAITFALDNGGNIETDAKRDIPMRRPGEMREIGETAVFLASEHASYITGQDITVDGGMMALGAWANLNSED